MVPSYTINPERAMTKHRSAVTAERPAPIERIERIKVLFEEYQALYRLAEFRLSSLDRRALAAWAALTAFLTTFTALNSDAQAALLFGAPMALLWLLRTTINHARSFEDALRRLDEIERLVNRLAGDDLLAFQSRHPSRGGAVGGRTGTETVLTVLATSLVMLTACGFLFYRHERADPGPFYPAVFYGYLAYLVAVACHYLSAVTALRKYRYQKARSDMPSEPAESPPRQLEVSPMPACSSPPNPSAQPQTHGTPPSTPDRTPP